MYVEYKIKLTSHLIIKHFFNFDGRYAAREWQNLHLILRSFNFKMFEVLISAFT